MVKARVQDCEKTCVRRGSWTPEEDQKLIAYIRRYGIWNWAQMPKYAGLFRTGKSCRLRWMNYLRPDVKRGNFSEEEEQIIINLHQELGNRWSNIASRLPGRTDNEIKNYWHTRLNKKRLKPTGLQETQTAAIDAPYASNSDSYKASPMSSQLSTDNYSSSSSDPTGEIYENQALEENIDLSEIYGELQSLLELSVPMEGFYMDEGFGATGPEFMVPTSQGELSEEELQIFLEQPFPMDGLDMMEGSKDPKFVKPTSEGGFTKEELQNLLDNPFPMENLGMLEGYGAIDAGSIVSTTPQVRFSNEELRSLLEHPFPIESLYVVEGYDTIKDPGFELSTFQWRLQEDPYSFASNDYGANDF